MMALYIEWPVGVKCGNLTAFYGTFPPLFYSTAVVSVISLALTIKFRKQEEEGILF